MKKVVMSIMLVVSAFTETVIAQQTSVMISDTKGWHKIGETTVNFQKETDEISIIGANRFASVIFRVADAPINLISAQIFYESGDMQAITLNSHIKVKGESDIINLNGGERNLKKIVFVYKTLPNRKDVKAHIEIYGLKTNTDAR